MSAVTGTQRHGPLKLSIACKEDAITASVKGACPSTLASGRITMLRNPRDKLEDPGVTAHEMKQHTERLNKGLGAAAYTE